MHPSALRNAKQFFTTYVPDGTGRKVIEIGSQDVNGSIREVSPIGCHYTGLDFVEAKGVDIVLDKDDPYTIPFPDNSVDIIVTSSVFEHSEFFWLLFNELIRTLKDDGLLYINAPSFGSFHRYPVDCYRFYPDFGKAMEKWAHRSGYTNVKMLESFICRQDSMWHDNVSIYLKSDEYLDNYPNRILDLNDNVLNAQTAENSDIQKYSNLTEPELKMRTISRILAGRIKIHP